MKFFILFLCLILSISRPGNAQGSLEKAKSTSPTFSLSQSGSLLVKDSAGVEYETSKWQSLLMSGKYGLRLMADRKTTLIYKLSQQELNKKYENLPKPMESPYFKTGAKVSTFRESDIKGNKFSIKDLAGKIVVLNFWFIGCPPCRQEIPELNELVEKYQDNKDVVFIAISLDEKRDIMDFIKTTPFKYNIIDRGKYIADQYKILNYPTNVVIGRQGSVVFHSTDFFANTVFWIGKSIDSELSNKQ